MPSETQRNQIREIIVRRGNDAAAPAQLIQLTREMPAAAAAELFDEIAEMHVERGQLGVAAHYRKLLIEKYPDQPSARAAAVWLVAWMSSSELATLERSASSPEGASATAVAVDPAVLSAALHYAGDAMAAAPSLRDDPEFVFLQSVAERRRNGPEAAAGWWTLLKHRGPNDLWQRRVLAETWLKQRRETDRPRVSEPAAIARCLPTRTRPTLDGHLDELLWTTARPVPIVLPAGASAHPRELVGPTARARFGYDERYLYIALEASKVAGQTYPTDPRPRTEDSVDATLDRIVVELDPDRDYATAYELTVDSRGWPADAVWGQAAWNPQWYVAQHSDDKRWMIEAAIAWTEMTPAAPTAGDAWVVAVDRLLPGRDPSDSTASYRLLLFE